MPSVDLALPMLGMMILTLLVWVSMFIQRVSFARDNKIDIEDFKTPADVQALMPGDESAASNNFKNLFELPVIFYAICIYLIVTLQVDSLYVNCAWAFLVLRVLHSFVHCSYNKVAHRFALYLLSGIALWIMVVRAFLAAL
tara:strand:+ start:75780 stop:76202 length:423 start_codon:yes stop_codon:yes gene_type:complete